MKADLKSFHCQLVVAMSGISKAALQDGIVCQLLQQCKA
jgi:hypothetical protein